MTDYLPSHRAAEWPHRLFWTLFDQRHPDEKAVRGKHGQWFWQRGLLHLEMVITMYVLPQQDLVGVFFGRNEKLGAIEVDERLGPHFAMLKAKLRLRPEQRSEGPRLGSIWRVNCFAEDNWPAMGDWLTTRASRSERAVDAVLGEQD